MRNIILASLLVAVTAAVPCGAASSASGGGRVALQPVAASPPFGLEGGASSVDALVERLLEALERRDKKALRDLSVTEQEYRQIIVPGRVTEGMPPRQPAKRNVDYFWSTMAFKSELYADKLVETFGGRKYSQPRLQFTRSANEWAWYTAYGELRMRVVCAEEDKDYLLQAGWIVEVDGTYKFLSYEYDS